MNFQQIVTWQNLDDLEVTAKWKLNLYDIKLITNLANDVITVYE